ncbi:MAG: helix-turn-helix transcriptional regulator [Vicinamibacterales bacterium]
MVLDLLPFALIVVDDRVRPCVVNARAREALAKGLRLDDEAVAKAVAEATSPTASWLTAASVVPLRLDGAVLSAVILPSRIEVEPLLMRRGLAFVAFGSDTRTLPRDLLGSIYGLTRRECDLAFELLKGRSVAEAARSLQMTLPTARTHLRHLLEKTGTTRQGALLRMLLGSVP